MNCGYCFNQYRKTKIPPACFAKQCPIEDIAEDLELNRIIDGWLSFKLLGKSEGYEEVQRQLLKDLGLDQEVDLLVEFETILSEHLRQKQKSKEQQHNTKTTRKFR